jgi:nucleotide-binding universal stress UspA family protein
MKILLPVDDSDSSRHALRALTAHIRAEGAEVRVLNVVEQISGYISADLIPHRVSYVAEIERERRQQAERTVNLTVETLRKAGFRATGDVVEGDPKSEILDVAAKWGADLIVIGSHGWKGLNRFLLGSVSEAVARHAECSVEIVRSPQPEKRAKPRRSQR